MADVLPGRAVVTWEEEGKFSNLGRKGITTKFRITAGKFTHVSTSISYLLCYQCTFLIESISVRQVSEIRARAGVANKSEKLEKLH